MVTFIIPTINRPSLVDSVNSLLKQKNPNWKCIILFDGTEKIEFNDNRIITLKIEKKGTFGKNHGNAGLVRNIGIDMANTEWIAFLDDDDTINENYVDWLMKYASKDYELVIFRMIMPNGRIIPAPKKNKIELNDVGISFAYKKKIECRFINSDGEDFHFLNLLKDKVKKYIIAEEVAYNVRK